MDRLPKARTKNMNRMDSNVVFNELPKINANPNIVVLKGTINLLLFIIIIIIIHHERKKRMNNEYKLTWRRRRREG